MHPVLIEELGFGCDASSFCYKPMLLSLRSGDSVKWTSYSGSFHTVTRCTRPACGVSGGTGTDHSPNSRELGDLETYQVKFVGKGTYVYYCKIRGYAVMHGTLIVR